MNKWTIPNIAHTHNISLACNLITDTLILVQMIIYLYEILGPLLTEHIILGGKCIVAALGDVKSRVRWRTVHVVFEEHQTSTFST